MRPLTYSCSTLLLLSLGCGSPGIGPSDNDQQTLQTALLNARPGTTIELGAGTFHVLMGLSLTVNDVTLKGQGAAETILSFKGQTAGSNGLLVKANGFTVQDLAVEDTAGDAIKVEGGKGVVFRRVRAEWTGGPNSQNGAYGLYPVQCQQVLIEDSTVKGASDAGIYVGQSDTIILRRNHSEGNVAGIEIENSKNADVYENTSTGNTAGVAVFDLPGLPVKDGQNVRVFNNKIVADNHDNFAAKGNTVSQIPAGTGAFIMANKKVEVFGNTIQDNQTVSLGIISYYCKLTGCSWDDPAYYPYPLSIYVHDNTIIGGGTSPDTANPMGILLKAAFKGNPVPDIIHDGIYDPMKLMMDGKLPAELRICVKNNTKQGGPLTVANLDAVDLPTPKPVVDAAPYDCTQPPLPAVQIAGVH